MHSFRNADRDENQTVEQVESSKTAKVSPSAQVKAEPPSQAEAPSALETEQKRETEQKSAMESFHSTLSKEAQDPDFNRPNKGVSRAVFYPSVILLLLLVGCATFIPVQFEAAISWASTTVINNISWYYVLIATGFVGFMVVLTFSRFGEIKLGDDDEEPEYSVTSWFAMLFAAGMGIGLVFYGAGEPLSHFASPRPGQVGEPGILAQDAMATTFLHWGLHPWSIYVVVGLGIAYSHFRKKRPISIRWALEPLLGEKRVRGGLGHVIDVVSVLGTVLGISTSLGFGVSQVAAGIEYLTGFSATKTVLVVLVIVISSIAGISVATGIDNGIKFLSNTNLILAGILAFAVAALGPTTFILSEFVQDIGIYLQNFFRLSFQTLPFQGFEGVSWLSTWTTYYWGWWISWSPAVGIFIARISRGRTIREFVAGVMLVPTLVTFLWFAIIGGNALYLQLFKGTKLLTEKGLVDINVVLFQSFEPLYGGKLLSGLAMVVVCIFFITSSDSGSYVMAMLSCEGDPNPALFVRLTWATMSGLVTAVILGTARGETGMAALQALAILSALPFSLVMIGICVSMWRSLSAEHRLIRRQERRLRHQLLVENVSSEVYSTLEKAARENPNSEMGKSRGRGAALKHSPSPIPVAPEIVKILRRARNSSKKTGDSSKNRKKDHK